MTDEHDDAQSQRSAELRVPVDRRFLGLDRRTIGPALFVMGLLIVLTFVLPVVYAVTPYDDKVEAGDVLGVKGGITFVPTPGWGITSGVRVSDATRSGEFTPSATVEDGDVALTVSTGPFSGTAQELLGQLETIDEKVNDDLVLHTTGPVYAIATSSGIDGVARRYTGTKTDGLEAAFVVDGTGVRVVLTGPPGQLEGKGEEVGTMIASISQQPAEGSTP